MARTSIAVQSKTKNTGVTVSYAAADSVNGMQVVNDGNTELIVVNASGSSINCTVRSVACSHGRTSDLVQAVAAATTAHIGPFDPALFNQGGGVGGIVNVDFSAAASVTVAAVKTT